MEKTRIIKIKQTLGYHILGFYNVIGLILKKGPYNLDK